MTVLMAKCASNPLLLPICFFIHKGIDVAVYNGQCPLDTLQMKSKLYLSQSQMEHVRNNTSASSICDWVLDCGEGEASESLRRSGGHVGHNRLSVPEWRSPPHLGLLTNALQDLMKGTLLPITYRLFMALS